jgi:hypothetical protein
MRKNVREAPSMGYFDTLDSGSFKTAADGRTLFFPFGVFGRGYEVATERDCASLRWQVKAWLIGGIISAVGALELLGNGPGLVAGAALIALYHGWAWYVIRGMRRSEERLSLRENLTTQARAQNPVLLWAAEIVVIVLLLVSIDLLAAEPENWLLAVFMIVVFATCAVAFGFMLVLRRQS